MKRQRSRNRGGGGGGKPQHNANRAFESNGPDGVKIRGAAQHVFEKYQQLARDALTSGDRVLAESYQQHAEHYFRVLRAVQPQRQVGDIMGRDAFASGYDIDFEDESGEQAEVQPEVAEGEADRGEWRQENRYEGRRDERPRDDRQRDDRPRDRNGYRDDQPRNDQSRNDQSQSRNDQPRNDQSRNDRNGYRDDRGAERPRDDQSRNDQPRNDQSRNDQSRNDQSRNERNDRYRDNNRYERNDRDRDPLAVVEPQATPLTGEADPTGSPFLRSQDGGVSQAPAFLQARTEPRPAPAAGDDENAPKVRRRRPQRDAGDGDKPASTADVTEDA